MHVGSHRSAMEDFTANILVERHDRSEMYITHNFLTYKGKYTKTIYQ